ncbi:potassium channel family protein [Methanobrevibacter cuticularis]|nr:potassium channel family protein [Methanobrevibacter cuticularis]
MFPIKPISINEIALFDIIISLLLLLFIGINHFILDNIANMEHDIVVLIAIIPFESIFFFVIGTDTSYLIHTLFFIVTIFHIVGLLLSLQISGSKFIEFTENNGLGYGLIITASIFVVSSVLFFMSEVSVNPKVFSFEDAVWYAIVSITTTGYGDIVPSTLSGRIIGSVLMITGISFTTFATASVAGSIITKLDKRRENVRKDINIIDDNIKAKFEENQKQINEIKMMIENLNKK